MIVDMYHSGFNSRATRVAIHIKKNVPFIATNTISDNNDHFVIVTGKLYNTLVVLAVIYLTFISAATVGLVIG